MKLPFLKRHKLPRVEIKNPEEKLINGSAEDHLEDYAIGEMMEAISEKNIKKFRSALEAMVLNQFEEEEEVA